MREALTLLLCSRYPVLFAEYRLDAAEAGMAWGFQHDDGWFALVDALAAVVTAYAPMAVAQQVKQKMGVLRVSLREGDAFTRGACAAAERFSQTISEVSGRRGMLMVRRLGRWLKTRAPGEIADFVPIRPRTAGSAEENLADEEIDDICEPYAATFYAAGEAAFHDAMARRLHPITGDCGPVNDQGEMTDGGEGR